MPIKLKQCFRMFRPLLIHLKQILLTPYSAQDLDYILADTSSGSLTILLPTIGSVRVKWINGSADVILNAGSGKTIDGVQTFTMATPKDCVVTDARTSGVHYLV